MVRASQNPACLVWNWGRDGWDFLELLLFGKVFSLGGDGSQTQLPCSILGQVLQEAFPGRIAKCCLPLLCGGLDSVEMNKPLTLQQCVWV